MTEDLIFMSNKELSRLEVMQRLENRILTQAEAADILCVSVRQVKRLWKAYKKEGPRGLISKKRGQPGNHRLPLAIREQVLRFASQEQYRDFGPTLLHEKLVKSQNVTISVSSVRNLMIRHELWVHKKIKRRRIYQLRERRGKRGSMVQLDGSEHDWFEGRAPKCTLLVYIDDATNEVMLRFVKAETVFDYFESTKEYLKIHGRPESFYTDKHVVFRVNREGALSGDGHTQFGRAMQELEIKLIYANSPQAKGRVERCNRTLQDRLIKEMRLRNICSIEEANIYLPSFAEEYNRQFGVVPKSPVNAHRPLPPTHNLDQIFTVQENRHLSKNLTLQYKNVIYQIQTDRESYALRKARVRVCEDKEGKVRILYKGQELKFTIFHQQQKQGPVVGSKLIDATLEERQEEQPSKRYIPPRRHPWKRWRRKSAFAGV